MKLQLKRSNVLDGSERKGSVQQNRWNMENLLLTLTAVIPVLFIKNSDDSVIRIAGAGAPGGGGGAGDGLEAIPNGNNFNLAVKAEPGYGIGVSAAGVRIGDDWSAIPSLPA